MVHHRAGFVASCSAPSLHYALRGPDGAPPAHPPPRQAGGLWHGGLTEPLV